MLIVIFVANDPTTTLVTSPPAISALGPPVWPRCRPSRALLGRKAIRRGRAHCRRISRWRGSDIQARLMGQWRCSQRRIAAEDRAAESDDLIKGDFAFVG
jgi:hypothetical protein